MNDKYRLLLLGVIVASSGIVLGTALWIRLAPHTPVGGAQRMLSEEMSQYGSVPDFSLVERSGKQIGLAQLRGTIWVADFIYTNCEDTCPLQTAEMVKLQEELAPQTMVKLLSFSVDPRKDTPAILSQYADRFNADADRWLFLTGGHEEVQNLVQNGFRVSAASGPTDDVILHSPRFVLIDRHAQIRGYYDSRDKKALQRLRKDIGILAKQ